MKQLKLFLTSIIAIAFLSACGSSDNDNANPGGGGSIPGGGSSANDPWLVSAWFAAGANNRTLDPMLAADGTPTASSPELKSATYHFTVNSPDLQAATYMVSAATLGAGFVDTDYIGAFAQDTVDNWTDGWTVSLNGNKTVWEPAAGGTLNGATPAANGTCPAGTSDQGAITIPGGGMMDLCRLARRYTTSVTLTNDNVYELQTGFPGTLIGDGEGAVAPTVNVVLTIEPGTVILGRPQEALIITRGSEIAANGTAADPIVMTSAKQFNSWADGSGDGTSGRGEWAGLALMGNARTNECAVPCNVAAEGNIGNYGGSDDTDDSGTVEYVVIRHAGNDIDGNGNELNGFTLFGVGSGTTINHIQVHKGLDDGVEHFGSSDFMSHIVITDARDDSFDWGQGYTGGAQFVVIRQAADEADRGIEADNDSGDPAAIPVSKPTLANFTIIGQPGGDQKADGVLLRRGTGALIYNSIIAGFGDSCLHMTEDATLAQAGVASDPNDGNLQIHNSVVYCPTGKNFKGNGSVTDGEVEAVFTAATSNRVLSSDINLQPNGQPNAASGSTGSGFVSTDYVGAFDPNAATNWTHGWTVALNGNNTVWTPAKNLGALAADGDPDDEPTADDVCPSGTTDQGNITLPAGLGGGSMDLCRLARRYMVDVALTNDNIYELQPGFPGTQIGDGDGTVGATVDATLKIEPGTMILGQSQEALVITRSSRVEATGAPGAPIVMTSRTQFDAWLAGGDGTSGRGEWAGFALMGNAPTNECGTPCNVAAEGNIGNYGGSDNADDSGIVSYVVIRHAGNDIDGNGNELNGFTLFGVGSGTTINHIQVHNGLDDGVEHFGSTDFMSHVVITGAADDSFDWGQGYRGGAQFVVIKQASDAADRGIEADNDGDDNNAAPISRPTLANFTMIGEPAGDEGAGGILLRRGTGAVIWNSIVTGFADGCVDIDDDATFARAGSSAPDTLSGDLVMNNSIVSCATNFDEE